MNQYLVIDKDSNFQINQAYSQSALKNVVGVVPNISGNTVLDVSVLNVYQQYYSGFVLNGSIPYVSGEMISGETFNVEYGSNVEVVGSDFTGEGVKGPLSSIIEVDEGQYSALNDQKTSALKTNLLSNVNGLKDHKIKTGNVTYSGVVYSTSEEMVGNLTSLLLMLNNGIAPTGGAKVTAIDGSRISHNADSLKELGQLIADYNDEIYASGAAHIQAINALTTAGEINNYNVSENWP